MPSKLLIALAVVALLSGCTKQGEQALNDGYDKNFMESCTSSATKGAMTATMAQQVCKCTIDGINQKYSAAEKLVTPAEKLKPIMLSCVSKVVQQ